MRRLARILAFAAIAGSAAPVQAQTATDIFLAELRIDADGIHVGTPDNVTDRAGYDNQPWFLPDGKAFLYVSQRDGQTDVFRHDLDGRQQVQLTRTAENEYSPSLPGDGSRLLVVRWAPDMSAGALWWYSADGEPQAEATGSAPRVGYYAFADAGTLALFINDEVQSFLLADTASGETTKVGEAMGGSAPRAIPGGGAVSFLRQDKDETWWLSRLDVATRKVTPLVRMLEGVANYTWTADGRVLAARGNTLHLWAPGRSDWQSVHSFDAPGLQSISRIALSPKGDRIALVSDRPEQ